MADQNIARPGLTLLSAEQVRYVHQRSLDILRQIGVRLESAAARQIFAAAPGAKFAEGNRVHLEAELVEWAIETAPATVDIYQRSGKLAFRLGAGRTRFGVGVTNLYYQDPHTDQVTPFTRQHMALATRLSHNLPNFDLVSTIGVLQDYPPETADLYAGLEMAANTTKPLVALVSNESLFSRFLDLFTHLFGDLSVKPFLIPYFNPITPLVINPGTADKMLEALGRGLPVIYSNYSMAGMTTPITAAGTLALMNAELLAGLTLAQLARPGAAVILGSLPAFFDMRTMQDFYDPQSFLINMACAEMMAHYRLPHAGTSGSGIGWGADLAAGGQLWLNHLTSLLGKSGMAPFVGGTLGSKAFCPALVVYSNDVIGQALSFYKGMRLDDEVSGLADIEKAAPLGNFMDSDLTMKLFREAYYDSKLCLHWSLERWQERSQPRLEDLLRVHTLELLENAAPPEDHDEVLAKGAEFIAF